jgi:formylglycine-generating enzyme required for sulfatase activity
MSLLKNILIGATSLLIGCSDTNKKDLESKINSVPQVKSEKISKEPAQPADWTNLLKLEQKRIAIDLGEGVEIRFVKIPAGMAFTRTYNFKNIRGLDSTRTKEWANEEGTRDREIHNAGKKSSQYFLTEILGEMKPFYISETEVTYAQWAKFRPGHVASKQLRINNYDKPNFPIQEISPRDAVQFCNWLSSISGKKVSIPSEEQWDYVFMEGEPHKNYPTGDKLLPEYGNFSYMGEDGTKIISKGPKEIKSFKPNKFGVYDMPGNLSDLVRDKGFYLMKGGSFQDEPIPIVKREKAPRGDTYADENMVQAPNTTIRLVINP